MDTERVYRVTVRGRFAALDDTKRSFLKRTQPEHDLFKSAFTPEGTFTFDERIQFFNFRYELRTAEGDAAAGAMALAETTNFLSTLGLPHKGLKADVVDVSAIWDDPRIARS
ncbi:MAG: DUF6204 family protein [Actinomycetota bacterium]